MKPEDFTVGWICALPLELAAAESMYDKQYESVPRPDQDDNAYSFGRIGEHNVVAACLPAATTGTSSAANVATRLQASFPCVRIGLMVGIGGGVPSDRHDIRLGDVVVSKPDKTHGGVVQWDFGKTVRDGKFTRTGQLARPPKVLLSAVSTLEARRIKSGPRLALYMSDAFEKHPDLSETCSYQGQQHDRLFQPDYHHPDSSKSCQGCDASEVVPRDDRPKLSPKVHYGLIASGNQVMKDATSRDRLAREMDIICFEMESAGLMNDFPCLVIRGVSDYSDTHKNDEWQGYAALAAAAYAKELLNAIPGYAVVETAKIGEEDLTLARSHELVKYTPKTQKNTSMISREAWELQTVDTWPVLLARLSDYNQERAHWRLKQKRSIGTTEWFLQHPTFSEWLTKPKGSSAIWFSGKLGCGKTMICTSIIDHLRESIDGKPLLYFYCESSDPKTLDGSYLLRSLIKQGLDHMSTYMNPESWRKSIRTTLETVCNPSSPAPDLEDVVYLFSLVSDELDGAYIMIDGVDELVSSTIQDILKPLHDVAARRSGHRRVFVSSRDDIGPNVKISFPLHVQISVADTKSDIACHVELEIAKKMSDAGRLSDDDKVIDLIKETLISKAQGMFLWVQLQIAVLWDTCSTDGEIKHALENLPEDLVGTYERCLQRIAVDRTPRALAVLGWVACASRPLLISEMKEAIAFDLSDRQWNSDKIPSQETVIKSCANLVILDEADSTVRFPHLSVKQFLCDKSRLEKSPFLCDEEQGQLKCGEYCVAYMSFTDFNLQLQTRAPDIPKMALPASHAAAFLTPLQLSPGSSRFLGSLFAAKSRGKKLELASLPTIRPPEPEANIAIDYAFLDYARDNWVMQTKSITRQSALWDRFIDLALQPKSVWNIHPWSIDGGQSYASHLHGLLAWGVRQRHLPLLGALLKNDTTGRIKELVNLPYAKDGLPALHIACHLGFTDVVRLLLTICDVNTRDSKSRTALYAAAKGDHRDVVKVLLATSSIKIDLADAEEQTALWAAAKNNHLETARMLLNAGATVTRTDRRSMLPLRVASSKGHLEMVRLLLEKGSKLNARNGPSPLYPAAFRGHEEIAQLLIERGAKVDSKEDGRTPLCAAAFRNHERVVKLLMNSGAKVDERGDGDTPLYFASHVGHANIVRILIDHGANVELKNRADESALWIAAHNGRAEVVTELLKHGKAFVDSQKGNLTPLLAALKAGHAKAAWFLITNGADKHATDYDLETPLHIAVRQNFGEAVRLLVDRGVNQSRRNKDGFTAVHLAIKNNNKAMIHDLIDHCRPSTELGHELLGLAFREDNFDMVELLLKYNCFMIDPSDDDSPLCWAIERRRIELVRLLLSTGVDKNAAARALGKPLRIAIRIQDETSASLLIDAGADVNGLLLDNVQAPPTPLLLAIEVNSIKMAQLLLDRGADISHCPDWWPRPLWVAVWSGNVELSRLLLEHGANADGRSPDRSTPLLHAIKSENVELSRLLLEHGADANAESPRRLTPLYTAVQSDNVELTRLLLEHRADPDGALRGQSTPLVHIAQRGHVELGRLLLEHGASVNGEEEDLVSPLYAAAGTSNVEMVRLLIERGAKVDENMWNPLTKAAQDGSMEIVCLLANQGADVNKTDRRRTALDWVQERGFKETALVLRGMGAKSFEELQRGKT